MSAPHRGARLGWALAAVVVVVAGGGWWVRRALASGQKLPSAVVQMGDLSEYVSCSGTLSARQAAVLIIPQRIENLRITYLAPEGSKVTKGEVVVRLDVTGLRQTADQLALALRTAQATLDQAQAQAAITHQQDLMALAQAQVAEGEADIKAREDSVKSRIAGEESALALATAKAVVAATQAANRLHAAAAAAQLQSLVAARDKAAAQLKREQAAVSEATLRARMAGIITYSMNYSNYSDAHAYRVGDTVSAGDEVAQIPDLSTLEVDAGVRQTDRGQVRVGDAVTAQAPSLPEVQLSGRVQSISALTSLDFSGSYPPPRIFSLVASLSHPDARLRPNMKVAAKLITRQLHQVALAPAQAVFTHQGQATMYVLEGGRYQPRRVRLLGRNPSEVAVAGVAAGARVALVEPGVKPANTATTAAGAAGLEGGHR